MATLALSGDVPFGSHVIGSTVDVVVFAAATGLIGRVLTWDLSGVNENLAKLVAVPATLLVDRELGADTCVAIDVWDLEHGARWTIARQEAIANRSLVQGLLDRTEVALSHEA